MKLTIAVCIILTYIVSYNPVLFSQDKPEKTIESAVQKGSGNDNNITSKSNKNDPNDKSTAPSYKDESRGSGPGICTVTIKNFTNWYIDIYMDGKYIGEIGPWQDAYSYTGTGATKIYVKAQFDDGSYYYWGPTVFDCDYKYIWKVAYP
jgi:hypothetical protein